MRFIALLRAINVGGHTVRMEELRALFEEEAFTGVRTFIASGNVLFDTTRRSAPAIETAIESRLRAALGYDVATFLRTPAELDGVLATCPFQEKPGAGLHVGFARSAPDADAAARVAELSGGINTIRVVGREIYWFIDGRFSDSKLSNGAIERKLGGPATFRSITTVRKLAALANHAG